uniref:Probable weak neurotoxin 3FTx-Lio1 n=1 Tax=Erythrolamprus poecilogyrus TaxID=338838 RepID=3NX1_ERYPO|nr:RecName: Full=Probable weak neurotoxin 3FTx-Lio1; Flags: Precursor [Erythrolamprus poecilogyrus]ABU68470.1 3FTx-Lio1 [Erythrolamprus poecilogyrus]
MKAVILSLVAAFLYSGYTLNCRKCDETVCQLYWTCTEAETLCYILKNKTDTMGLQAIQGCAETCPVPEPDQEVKCCKTDYCNSYF